MIEVRKATHADIRQAVVEARAIYSGEGALEHALSCMLTSGACHALISDGDFLGVLGGIIICPGVAEVGAVFTDRICGHPVGFTRTVMDYISGMMDRFALHRVQMSVKVEFAAGQRFARALGFTPEGYMKAYNTAKEDYILYARVR